MKIKHPILEVPVNDIDVSKEFKDMCALNKFRTLKEIISCSTLELLKRNGFSMHIMMELIDILEKHGLRAALEEP